MKKRVVIVDDESTIRLSLKFALEDEGFEVWTEETGESGLQTIAEVQPDLVFLDIRLPGKNGIEILKEIKEAYADTIVMIMTAYGNTQTTVEALKQGAYDYINKPFELDEILILIEKVLFKERMKKELDYYRQNMDQEQRKNSLICQSVNMLSVLDKINRVSDSDTNVLITGDTGTGKELVAKEIHNSSKRRPKPFVELNCGAIPGNLLESELFGFEKHAFTSADKSKIGLLELANEGTLFLDEIGEMPLDIQVKLLRFLEDRKIRRLGATREVEVDVRIIAATNRSLKNMAAKKAFREDLYYRLNVVPIHLPPLRERGEDITLLAKYFLGNYCKKMGKSIPGYSPAVLDLFRRYSWPGNVRELKNLVERLVILNHETLITPSQLPEEILSDSGNNEGDTSETIFVKKESSPLFDDGFKLERELENIEKSYIDQALALTRWNLSKSAKILGISRFSLQRRVQKYYGNPSEN